MSKKFFLLAVSLLIFSAGCSSTNTDLVPITPVTTVDQQTDLNALASQYEAKYESKIQSVTRFSEITPEDTYKALQNKTHILLDVREQNEYDAVHIKDIKLLPLSILPNEIGKLDKKQKYITICHSGRRSAIAAGEMEKIGLTVFSMTGGMTAWQAKNLPVVKPAKR